MRDDRRGGEGRKRGDDVGEVLQDETPFFDGGVREQEFLEVVAFAAADVDDEGAVRACGGEDGGGGEDFGPRREVVFGVALHGGVEVGGHGGVGGEVLEEVVGGAFGELPVGVLDVGGVLVGFGGEEGWEGKEHGGVDLVVECAVDLGDCFSWLVLRFFEDVVLF